MVGGLVQREGYVIAKERDSARPWSCYQPHYSRRGVNWASLLDNVRPRHKFILRYLDNPSSFLFVYFARALSSTPSAVS
jgi:hypothetical protein